MGNSVDDLIKNWNNSHYVAYLYICIGKSDYNLVDEEINQITSKLGGSLSSEDTKKVYEEALKVYNAQSDTEIISFIKKHSSDFSNSESEISSALNCCFNCPSFMMPI